MSSRPGLFCSPTAGKTAQVVIAQVSLYGYFPSVSISDDTE